jgi:rubredoxin
MGNEDKTKKLGEPDPNRLPSAIANIERRLAEIEERFKSQGYMTRPQHEEALRALQERARDHEVRLIAVEDRVGREQGVQLVFEDFAYFTPSGDGPFCQKCYDESEGQKRCRLRHLQSWKPYEYQCTVCSRMFFAGGGGPRRTVHPGTDPLAGY